MTKRKIKSNMPIHKRLLLSEDQYIQYLTDLYGSGLSQQKIADKLAIYVGTIEKHFKKYGILAREPWSETYTKKLASLTEKQYEVLDGILLADGCLDASSRSGRLTYGCKFKETLSDISKEFSQLHFSSPWQSKVTKCWHFKSAHYADLKKERKRWYPKGIKIIPEDVRITPASAYWWFVGDGYQVDYGVQLCTESFDKESMDIVRSKLLDLGFDSHITPSSKRLRIKGKNSVKFLGWAKSETEVSEQYAYKWGNHRKQLAHV